MFLGPSSRLNDVSGWLNRDPIGEFGGLNLYAYVGNNPINFLDPMGLDDWAAATWRVWDFAFTYHSSLYDNSNHQAQDATNIHEDIHRYNQDQQTMAFWNSNQHEIDAYTAEINYTKGQIANLKLQIKSLQGGQCPDKQKILDLQNQIRNYYDSLQNAQAQLAGLITNNS